MNLRLLQTALCLSLAGSLLTGCPSDDDGDDTTTPKDTGVVDTGTTDTGTGMDAGMVDTGPRPDTGPPIDPCPDGTEGCECASTLGPMDMAFKQDDCASADLLCIPWDVITGRQDDVTGPVHSCVKSCATDADCDVAGGQTCADMGFDPVTGAGRFCVDEVAELDEFCGGSRLTVSQLPMVTVETAGRIVGCPGTTTCSFGSFNDVHPDEGICVEICDTGADCGGATPYCNPIFRSMTTTVTQGICSIAALGPGAICGTTDPDKVGLVTRCDADAASPVNPDRGGCVAQNLYNGAGFCAQFCGSANPCTGQDDAGPFVCDIFDDTDAMFGGFCNSQCSSFPENCPGMGATGDGRFCTDQLGVGIGDVGVNICMDRSGPALTPTLLTVDGTAIAVQGGNCDDAANPLSFTTCPEASFCAVLQAGLGACLYGCVRSATTAAGPQGGCEVVSATATCTPNLDMMGNETPFSVCGDM